MYCFNFFRNQLWRYLISYNSFRSVNMCSLEVVICEKRRTTISSRRGGAESLRTGGLKHFRTGKKVRTGGLLLLGWGSIPHYMPCRANILCEYYNIHIFSISGVAFAVSFRCYFQKLLVAKTLWNNFCCIVLLFVWAQRVCLRFLKFYFKLEILIFLPFVESVLVDMFS